MEHTHTKRKCGEKRMSNSLQSYLDSTQKIIMEYAIAKAKAKKEKAEVELETAKMQQQSISQIIMQETSGKFSKFSM